MSKEGDTPPFIAKKIEPPEGYTLITNITTSATIISKASEGHYGEETEGVERIKFAVPVLRRPTEPPERECQQDLVDTFKQTTNLVGTMVYEDTSATALRAPSTPKEKCVAGASSRVLVSEAPGWYLIKGVVERGVPCCRTPPRLFVSLRSYAQRPMAPLVKTVAFQRSGEKEHSSTVGCQTHVQETASTNRPPPKPPDGVERECSGFSRAYSCRVRLLLRNPLRTFYLRFVSLHSDVTPRFRSHQKVLFKSKPSSAPLPRLLTSSFHNYTILSFTHSITIITNLKMNSAFKNPNNVSPETRKAHFGEAGKKEDGRGA